MHSTPKDNTIQSMHGAADVNFKPYPESFSRSNQGPALGLRLHSYLGAAVCFSDTGGVTTAVKLIPQPSDQ